jgi:excisionase family DNA binding protein
MLKTRAGDIICGRAEPLTVDIPEACRLTGLGRSKLYDLIGSGEIRSVTVGRRRLIPMAALRDWLERLESVPSPAV